MLMANKAITKIRDEEKACLADGIEGLDGTDAMALADLEAAKTTEKLLKRNIGKLERDARK